MTEQVHDITSLPAPTVSTFKKLAKRTAVASVVTVVAAAIYLKVTQAAGESETVNDLSN